MDTKVNIDKASVDTVNRQFVISASCILGDEYTNYKFTKIYIDTALTFNCKDDASTHAMVFNIDSTIVPDNTSLEEYTISFDKALLVDDFENTLFFIWVEASCYNGSKDELFKGFGTTLSVKDFYSYILNSININEGDYCNINCSDVNFVLAWNGFNLAMALRNYKQMIYYWNILHKAKSSSGNSCNCNK